MSNTAKEKLISSASRYTFIRQIGSHRIYHSTFKLTPQNPKYEVAIETNGSFIYSKWFNSAVDRDEFCETIDSGFITKLGEKK